MNLFSILLLILPLKGSFGVEPVNYWSMSRVNKTKISSDIPTNSSVWIADNDFDLATRESPVGDASLYVNRQIKLSQLTTDSCVVDPDSCEDGMTLTFWLKVNSWKKNNYQVILRTTTNTGYRPGIYIGDKDNKGVLQFNIRTSNGHYFDAEISRDLVTSRWTHVAVTWNFTIGVKVYLNCTEHVYNKQPSQHQVEAFRSKVSEQFVLGDDKMESDFMIDEIRLFQSHLTQAQIKSQSFNIVDVTKRSHTADLSIYLSLSLVCICLSLVTLGRFLKRRRDRRRGKFKMGRWISNDGLDECENDITRLEY